MLDYGTCKFFKSKNSVYPLLSVVPDGISLIRNHRFTELQREEAKIERRGPNEKLYAKTQYFGENFHGIHWEAWGTLQE